MTDLRFRMDGNDLIEMKSVDVEPVLDEVKALQGAGAVGTGEMRHAAKVPGVVIENYCSRNGVSFQEFMQSVDHIRRLLNDPDLSGFRVWQGRV